MSFTGVSGDLVQPSLRPLLDDDAEWLYGLNVHPDRVASGRFSGRVFSFSHFVQHMWTGVLCQSVVVDLWSGRRLGHVSCINADLRNRIAYLTVIGDPAYDKSGALMLGLGCFVSNLFLAWQFRQLYAEIPEFNYDSMFASGEGWLFEVEGRLHRDRLSQGRYWDMIIVAIDAERWSRSGSELAARYVGSDAAGSLATANAELSFYQLIGAVLPNEVGLVSPEAVLQDVRGVDSLEIVRIVDTIERIAGAKASPEFPLLRSFADAYLYYQQCLSRASS